MSNPQKTAPNVIEIATGEKFSEAKHAELFLRKIEGSLKCQGENWFLYRDGVWSPKSRDEFRPVAQRLIPFEFRTARRAGDIIRHVENLSQVSNGEFWGAYRFSRNGKDILLNVDNGILVVSQNQEPHIILHNEKALFTAKMAAAWNSEADCVRFKKLLCESIPDEQDRECLLYFLAYTLLPDCRFQVAALLFGKPSCGKTTIAEAWAAVLGESNVRRLTLAQIAAENGYFTPRLKEAALNIGSEIQISEVAESDTFKALVSGEPITARPIGRAPVEVRTTAKLLFSGNHLPRFKQGSDAEVRRMRIINFSTAPAEPDILLGRTLANEKDGILALVVPYLQRLLSMKVFPDAGASSQRTLELFAIGNDPVSAFVRKRCILNPEKSESKDNLFSEFADFLEIHGLPVWQTPTFCKVLYERYPYLKVERPRGGLGREHVVRGISIIENEI